MRYNLMIALVVLASYPAVQWLVAHSSLAEFYRQLWEWGHFSGFGVAASWL